MLHVYKELSEDPSPTHTRWHDLSTETKGG